MQPASPVHCMNRPERQARCAYTRPLASMDTQRKDGCKPVRAAVSSKYRVQLACAVKLCQCNEYTDMACAIRCSDARGRLLHHDGRDERRKRCRC